MDDLASPRGTGRPETGRSAERGAVPGESGAGPVALAVLEAGDGEAEELSRDGPVEAVPGGARRGVFGGSAEGLAHALWVVSQPTPR